MKPTRSFLSSVIFLTLGAPLAHAAGTITIGGTADNISSGTILSPVDTNLDSTVSEFDLVNTLNGTGSVLVTNEVVPAGASINVTNGVTWTSINELSLVARNNISVGANITNQVGGNLILTALDGSVALNGHVRITGNPGSSTLTVEAATGITQDSTRELQVDGLASFDAGSTDILLTGANNAFGSLNLAGRTVSVREAGAMNLAGVSATTLGLISGGTITQTGAIQVGQLATFDAGLNAITLGNASNEFGRISLTGGAVSVSEANATDLASVSATSLSVTSGGALTNSGTITVSGAASITGQSINLGTGANTVSVGSLNVNSAGNVYLRLTSGTSFTGANSAGSLVWDTAGTATLAVGSSLTAGSVDISRGSIALTGNNQLVAGTATVGTGTTLNLGAFNNTVTTYNQNGNAILAGTGTLTAVTYNLNGGTVNANLGTGTLKQIGDSTLLSGISAATSVQVNAGTLTLGSSNRLADTANLAINGGILAIGNATDTVDIFSLNSGSLNGSGTLTASRYDLNGGNLNANLGAGTVNQLSGTTQLNGITAAATVTVSGGSLTLGSADRLANNAALAINGGALNLGSFNETVGSLVLGGGTLNGTGTLTAATYGLNGGTVNAKLGAGNLTQTGGSTLLNGTTASTNIKVSGGTLTLGATDRLLDTAALLVNGGTLDLAAFDETVASFNLSTGSLSGSGTLTAATYDLNGGTVGAMLGAGVLNQLSGSTVLNGTSASATINVTGGVLTLGASDRLLDTTAVTIGSLGTLNLGNSNDTVGSFVLNGGTLDGSGGTLTTAVYALNGGTVNGNLGAGILNQLAGTTVLNGTSAAASLNVGGGTLTLGANNRLDHDAVLTIASSGILNLGTFNNTVGSFILNGGALNGSGTLNAATYALNGGSVNGNLGAGILNQLAGITTLSGASSAGTVNVNNGTLALGASNRLSDSATVNLNAANLDLGAFNDTVGSLILNGGTLNGSGTLTATTYDLNGGTVNANLGAGTLNQVSNTSLLNGISGAGTVNLNGGVLTLGISDRLSDGALVSIASSAALNLGLTNDTVAKLTLNGGSLNGSGTLTATTYDLNGGTVNANLGAGTLNQLSNTTLLKGTAAAATVNINGGTLTLGASDRLANAADVTVNAGTLDLGTFSDTVGSFALNGGTLNGSGTLTATSYGLGGGVVNANLGAGTFNQLSGTTILNGSSSAASVNLNGGTLTLGASNRLDDSAAVALNSAILNLGSFSDTVGSFTLNGGTLNGSGTLTATTYGLNGGTLNANLGTGTLNQLSGASVLNGSSSAATVNINGGTLALGASNRLIDSAALTISGGALDLGAFNDSVATLAMSGGSLNGTGTLTAATYALSGGTVNANLGTGTLNQTANTTVLNGTSAAATVNVSGGTLSLGASDRLANNAALTISNLGTLNLGTSSDTVGSLVLNGGTLNGSGTLTAASYTLNGGSVNANLGAGVLTQAGGTTTLAGTSAAATVNVNGGTLTLGASDRLANNAALTIASTGVLNLGSSSDTVGSFVLNDGTLNGSGTLTAATYSLNGGTLNANLGAGILNQLSGTTVLNGISAAATVNISAGTLKLGASDRLADNAAVTIAGILDIGSFTDSIGSLTMAGGTINGTGVLTAGSYDLNGINVNANLGAGSLNQLSGNTILNGSSAGTSVNVNGGTLTLGSSERLLDSTALTVNAGTLDIGAFIETVGNATLNGGTLAGTGTLNAASYSLNGGNVNANLGTGVLSQLSNTTVLNGSSSASLVEINGGTLTLGASNRLSNSSAVTIASAGVLNLGSASDSVGTLTLNGGTLNGSGTLSAASYAMNGGTVNGNLGAGTFNQISGTTILNGTSAAATVNLNGGTLTLGSSNRLSDSSTVTVASAGILNLGSVDDSIGTLTLNGGKLNGSGTLTASDYNLSGGTVNANLGTGTIHQLSGNTLLNGSSAAGMVEIDGGTLTLGSSKRLAGTAVVKVGAGTLDLGSFNDRIARLELNGGTLAGNGILTAMTYDLGGGVVNADLGTGTLNIVYGSTTLNGTSTAGTVTVAANLVLGASQRLADTSDVAVGAGGVLDLRSHSETVGTFTMNRGTLAGSGTLTAATYDLNGGTVGAKLGAGVLNQLAGHSTLNGLSAADTVAVVGGELRLGASDRLADSAAVSIALSSILDLGLNDETVARLTLNGGSLNGSGTLTAGRYQLKGGTVKAKLGKGILSQLDETTTITATVAASQVDVDGGTLVLGSSDSLANNAKLTINRLGKLDLGSGTDSVGSFTLNAGQLIGSGTLTADSYSLNGGVVDANLGSGTLNQLSGTSVLNGKSAAGSINITSGVLSLGASNRLSDNADISVKSAKLNLGSATDVVDSLTMSSAYLDGSGTLIARTYDLRTSMVVANLGGGTLIQSSGSSRLSGTSAAARVRVMGGVLNLVGSERLSDRSKVTVSGRGILKLLEGVETIAKYRQSGSAELLGNGNLKVSGLATLAGGTISGKLSGNTLTIGDVNVTGRIDGGTVRVRKGDLNLTGLLASDTRIGERGSLKGTGRITGNLRNFGDVAVGALKQSLNILGEFTNKGTVTLTLKNLSKFESIKATAVQFGGKLVIVNDGSGLSKKQTVQLFDAKSYSGTFDSITTVGFDNQLIFDETTGTLTGTRKKKLNSSKAAASSAMLAAKADHARPIEGIRVVDGRKYRTLTIARTPAVEVSARDIQVSSDRVEWVGGQRHITVLRDDAKALVVRDNTPVNQNHKRFIRLKP